MFQVASFVAVVTMALLKKLALQLSYLLTLFKILPELERIEYSPLGAELFLERTCLQEPTNFMKQI
jgi:hypothetical protein